MDQRKINQNSHQVWSVMPSSYAVLSVHTYVAIIPVNFSMCENMHVGACPAYSIRFCEDQ